MSKIKDYIVYFWKSTDKLLALLCLLASSFGVLMVTSATLNTMKEGALLPRDSTTMIVAVLLGFIIAMAISLVDIDIWCRSWYIWAAVGLGLMVFILFFGTAPSARSDARTWINLGIIYFQPSELVKVFFITTFAVHLDHVREELNKVKNVALLGLHALVPFLLVSVSGDDGSALVFLFIAFAMMFIAGVKWQYIIGVVVLAAAAIPLLWYQMSDFQKQRFIVIVDPDKYPATAYQQNLGLSALSNGGFLGQGLFKGTYTQSGAVPESENDFIFTVIGEELGTIGCIAALALLCCIIFRIVHDGKEAIEGPAQYIGYGVASMIGVQTFINIAMVLRIGPVIGITLPFFSAGGSSTLCLYVGLGLVFSIYRSVYSSTQETNFRLIGVRSPFNENFHEAASYKERTKDRSGTSRSSREIEPQRGRIAKAPSGSSSRKGRSSKQVKQTKQSKAERKAEKQAAKRAAKRSSRRSSASTETQTKPKHSATYYKNHPKN